MTWLIVAVGAVVAVSVLRRVYVAGVNAGRRMTRPTPVAALLRVEAAALDEQVAELRMAGSTLPPALVEQTRGVEIRSRITSAAVLRQAADVIEQRPL